MKRAVTQLGLQPHAPFKFPFNPPQTKEAYLYRNLFSDLFPSNTAAETVPGGASIACSTAEAIAWDNAFKNALDPSGRSINQIHHDSY